MTTAQNIIIKTRDQIRDDMIAAYINALITFDIVQNPVVTPGTETFNRFDAIAAQIWTASAAIPAAIDETLEDTAVENLPRLAALRGLSLRSAGGSRGKIKPRIAINSPVLIPAGSALKDDQGLRYRAPIGGLIQNGQMLDIEAIDTGAATNLEPGSVLTFEAPVLYVEPNAETDGLQFGVDAEDIEGLRARLLERLKHPPNGYNWSTFTAAAETSTAVQKAFAYCAANGPSTLHIAAIGAPSASVKTRDLDPLTLALEVKPAVLGATFSFVGIEVTTVVNEPVDVSIAIAAPNSPAADPPGAGGGWIDAVPFPVLASPGYVAVSNIVSSIEIEVSSDVPPVNGASISWVSTDDWKLRTAKILSFTGSNPYTLILDTPFTSDNGIDIAFGDWVFPAAENMPAYVDALFAAFAELGPGEKTNLAGFLPRALRKPSPADSWPYEIKSPLLKLIVGEFEEIPDAAYLYRSAVTPSLPALITEGPRVFVPRQIGFYPLE